MKAARYIVGVAVGALFSVPLFASAYWGGWSQPCCGQFFYFHQPVVQWWSPPVHYQWQWWGWSSWGWDSWYW